MRDHFIPRRRAFTLVEMLVVIAIIGVLAGLLLPAMSAARRNARNTTCITNLKDTGTALTMYTDAWNGFLPPLNADGTYSGLSSTRLRESSGVPVGIGKLIEGGYMSTAHTFGCPLAGCKAGLPRTPEYVGKAWVEQDVVDSAYLYRETDAGLDMRGYRNKGNKRVLMDNNDTSGDAHHSHGWEYVNMLFLSGTVQRFENTATPGEFYTHSGTPAGIDTVWSNADPVDY